MKIYKNIKPLPLLVAAALTAASCASFGLAGHASATPISMTSVRLDRLAISSGTQITTGGRVCFKPSVASSIQFVALTLPTNSGGTDYIPTAASMVASGVNDTSYPGTTAALPGMTAVTPTLAGKTLTWAFTAFTPSTTTTYCYQFNAGLVNATTITETTPGAFATQTAANAVVDSGAYSIGLASPALIGDQIAITGGTVPPTFQFALTSNAVVFTTNISLGTIASTTAGVNCIIKTNAANGYLVWVKNANAGVGAASTWGALNSAATGGKVNPTVAPAPNGASRILAANVEDYGLGATLVGSATSTVKPGYIGTGSAVGTLDPVNYQPLVTATAPTGTDTISIIERAASSTTTKAASDYADTITLTGAGLF